jgi:hypothetical protein
MHCTRNAGSRSAASQSNCGDYRYQCVESADKTLLFLGLPSIRAESAALNFSWALWPPETAVSGGFVDQTPSSVSEFDMPRFMTEH